MIGVQAESDVVLFDRVSNDEGAKIKVKKKGCGKIDDGDDDTDNTATLAVLFEDDGNVIISKGADEEPGNRDLHEVDDNVVVFAGVDIHDKENPDATDNMMNVGEDDRVPMYGVVESAV